MCSLYAEKDFENPDFQRELDKCLREAIKAHNTIMMSCLTGEGFDRHLFAIADQCKKQGIPMVSSIDKDLNPNSNQSHDSRIS